MKILTILLLFFFIFPIFPKFLPIPTDRLIEIFGLIYCLLNVKKALYIIGDKFILKTVGFAILLFIISFIPQLRNLYGFETGLIKISFDIILYIIASIFLCDLIKKNFSNFSLIKVIEVLILTFFIQGVVSLVFYFFPTFYNSYTNYLNTDVSQNMYERLHLAEVRLMGVGNAFFNGVIRYGINIILLTFLRYTPGSIFYKKGILFLFVFIFFIIVGVMTGRTFFVAILISLLPIIYYETKRIDKFIIKSLFIPILLILLAIPFYFLFSNYIDTKRLDNTLKFVLELYYNYEDSGQFTTNSSEGTLNMYIWPEKLSTWLIGDGQFVNNDGSYYMHTDIGYLRLIYYFGLFGTLIFLWVQFRIIQLINRLVEIPTIKYSFYFLFLWILILNMKGIAYLFVFEILFLTSAVYVKKNTNQIHKFLDRS